MSSNEIVVLCCFCALALIFAYVTVTTIYKSIMGEFFLSVDKSHRIAYKRGKFYPQRKHTWHKVWHHYKDIRTYKNLKGEWQTRKKGNLSFDTLEEALKFLGNLAWYN